MMSERGSKWGPGGARGSSSRVVVVEVVVVASTSTRNFLLCKLFCPCITSRYSESDAIFECFEATTIIIATTHQTLLWRHVSEI
jgi:hypothetical protein